MQVWIDLESGTWGDAEDIVFLEASQQDLAVLVNGSDQDRIKLGETFGRTPHFS